ncbi:MAG: VOC family protein [Paracoccaceae bacterium]
MIDHITFGVSCFDASVAFYDQAFKPLGVKRLFTVPPDQSDGMQVTGYGKDVPFFWIAEQDQPPIALHIALRAQSLAEVARFHTAALQAGGKDNGPPGLRPQYHPTYYACFVRDPDGHNIEAVFHG